MAVDLPDRTHEGTPYAPDAAPAPLRGQAARRTVLRTAIADRLPLTVRGARLGMDLQAVAVTVVAGLLGAAIGVGYLLHSRPAPLEAPDQPVVTSAAPGGPSPQDADLVIDVEGKVADPGIVRVPAGSRVIDAIEAAGGALSGVDTSALNLARLLGDGEQIFVGVTPPPGAQAPPAGDGPAGPLDLNTATLDQLEELPGVGPVLAQGILDYRREQGGFTSVDELRQVTGIGEKRFAELEDLVQVR